MSSSNDLDVDVVVRRHAVDVEDLLEPRALLRRWRCTMPLISTPSRRPNFSIIVPGTKGSVRSRVKLVAGIAEEAVAVGVHFEHAGAGNQRQRLAVFWVVEFLAIAVLAIGGCAAVATTSAATATAAASAATATAAAAAAVVSAAAATAAALTVAVSTAAATAAATTAAPTTFLLHVIQHLKQDPLSERPMKQTASTGPRGHKPCGTIHSKSGKRENSPSKFRRHSASCRRKMRANAAEAALSCGLMPLCRLMQTCAGSAPLGSVKLPFPQKNRMRATMSRDATSITCTKHPCLQH